MPLVHLALNASATVALGIAMSGEPAARAARASRDSVKPSADSAEARARREGDVASRRRLAAKSDLARRAPTGRALTGMEIAREADWAAERPVVPAPSYRRTVNGRLVADSVVVYKRARKLTLFYRGDSVATYFVALGRNPAGPKQRAGDGRTPEGLYRIDARNPKSRYYRALHISYPSASDRARAARRGVPTGGDILIHGLPKAYASFGDRHRAWDWTEGCIAVTDREIDEIYAAVEVGSAIEIRP